MTQNKEINWTESEMDARLEEYSEYLHDGDFEKYMPNIDLVPGTVGYIKAHYESMQELKRAYWIAMRPTARFDILWAMYTRELRRFDDIGKMYKNILDQIHTLEQITDIRISPDTYIKLIPGLKFPEDNIEI
jgi:hypothetical protein